jgi:hypothetical protein
VSSRLGRRLISKRAWCVAGVSGLLATAVLAVAASGAAGDEPAALVAYEAAATAEGIRFSASAPGFAAVDTFIDGGGPVAHALIDGLGNSRAFASLPYPGDLAISGPGLLAGLTGLPSPPPYPFYVDSSYPTKEESKFGQPGYELLAKSAALSSEGTASTGVGSEQGGLGLTRTKAVSARDAASGVVSAEASGTSDFIAVGPLRIGHVVATAKVTRAPGAEPTRESSFSIGAVSVNDQAVGISDKGFTVAGQTTPLPADNPLFGALKEAKISVYTLTATHEPDGVVSPGLVIVQQQQFPSGPTMIFRYVVGRMSARVAASGAPSQAGSELPLDPGPVEGFSDGIGNASAEASSAPTQSPVGSASAFSASAGVDAGYSTGPSPGASDASTAATAAGAEEAGSSPQGAAAPAAPISSASGPSARSVYLIVALGAIVALAGGLVIRLLGVKLAWTS